MGRGAKEWDKEGGGFFVYEERRGDLFIGFHTSVVRYTCQLMKHTAVRGILIVQDNSARLKPLA